MTQNNTTNEELPKNVKPSDETNEDDESSKKDFSIVPQNSKTDDIMEKLTKLKKRDRRFFIGIFLIAVLAVLFRLISVHRSFFFYNQ